MLVESGGVLEDLTYDTSLYSIADFLEQSDKYKIYHSLDDFFVNKFQLKKLKEYSSCNFICLNKGSHLGFLYRNEFLNSLKKEIGTAKLNFENKKV